MNALLKQIAANASTDLANLIEEGEKDILTAIHKQQSEAQLQETKPKFSLGFKITVDLESSTFDCDLSWTLKQTLGISHSIDDPAQEKLPLEDEKVTIKGDGMTVHTTVGKLKKISQHQKN